jgi:hypothetical protein
VDKSTGRTKPRRNVKPNERERAHHIRVMDRGCLVCLCNAIAHHVLQPCAGKRGRRDHEFVVPLCDGCHRGLHANGNEIAWQESFGLDLAFEAETLRGESIMEGVLGG